MHRVLGFVLFTAGVGFILLGAYLLCVGYTGGLCDWPCYSSKRYPLNFLGRSRISNGGEKICQG